MNAGLMVEALVRLEACRDRELLGPLNITQRSFLKSQLKIDLIVCILLRTSMGLTLNPIQLAFPT